MMHPDWCFVCNKMFAGQGALTRHALYCVRRNSEDRGHMALYALSISRRRTRRPQREKMENLFTQGLNAIEELMEVIE